MTGAQKPKQAPDQAPDGEPAPRTRDTESTTRSRVSEVQDPVIAGDAGAKAVDSGDVPVDDVGHVRPKKENPDLLH